jgi:hypothetical protein
MVAGKALLPLLWATPNQGHPNGKPPLGKFVSLLSPHFDFLV